MQSIQKLCIGMVVKYFNYHNTSAISTECGVHRVDQPCFQNFTHTQNVNSDPFKLQAQTCYLSLTFLKIKNVIKEQLGSNFPVLPQ